MDKLSRLMDVGVSREKLEDVLLNPEKVEPGYAGRKIAQGALTSELVLRVVYERLGQEILVITVYPGSKRRYQ